ncbi:hypothetical protein JCM8547_001518 [Rhodosporidiobolus lusitaniae]
MFKRPHTSKTSAPVRSSDLRKLRDELASSFSSSSSPPLSKDTLKLLLPDGTLTAKATTHLDEPVTLYFAPPAGGAEADCRAFRVGKGNDGPLVPSCYTLDLVPELLPRLETAPMVVENLVSGSALFLSGVSRSTLRALPGGAKEGDLVAVFVRDDEEKEQIVAVGVLAADKETLVRLQQEDGGTGKGKAVNTLHARGDYLWQSGSQLSASPLSSSSPPPASTSEEPSAASAATDDLTSTLASTSIPASSDPSPPAPEAQSAATAEELTTAEIDSLLLSSLLLSIQSLLSLPSSSSLFPMSTSTLYSSYVLPFRPASLGGSLKQVEMKKSKWKKLDKFVKEVSGKKYKGGPLLGAKEVRGEWVVTGVNGSHPDVESLRPYRTIARDSSSSSTTNPSDPSSAPASSTANGCSASATASGSSSSSSDVEVIEYFKPQSSAVQALLSHVEHDRPSNSLYTSAQLSTLLRTFFTTFSLPHPRSSKLLLLTPTSHPSPSSLTLEQESAMELLASVVCGKGESPEGYGEKEGRKGLVEREKVGERVRQGCVGFWGLRRKGEGEEVIKKGTPPYIKVAIKNVGKRQVTLISGHEPWSLFTSEELAEELKHKSASSTSVQPLAGSAKKNQTPKVEIMCQGTHDALVVKLLTTKFGVPKKYVEVDLSKSKK